MSGTEILGTILFVIMLVVFGGLFLIMAFASFAVSIAKSIIGLIQRLGFAAIIPAGIFAFFKYMDHKEEMDAERVRSRIGKRRSSARRWGSSIPGQSLFKTETQRPRPRPDAEDH